MSDSLHRDYTSMDIPEINMRVFHPRPEYGSPPEIANASDCLIPVDEDTVVGGRFHMSDPSAPNVLFFHGNGEIVNDYNDIGPIYTGMGMNFLPVDYRGYGRSTGEPTVVSMMKDCQPIFDFTRGWLSDNGYTGPLIVMGRSLGSASALELADRHNHSIDGLVIESGFANTGPLLALLGVDASKVGFSEENGYGNLDKIRTWDKPTLIIHAEFDHIIPFSDGRDLYDACPASDKTLLKINGANHNDIFLRGFDPYMKAVQALSHRVSPNVA